MVAAQLNAGIRMATLDIRSGFGVRSDSSALDCHGGRTASGSKAPLPRRTPNGCSGRYALHLPLVLPSSLCYLNPDALAAERTPAVRRSLVAAVRLPRLRLRSRVVEAILS